MKKYLIPSSPSINLLDIFNFNFFKNRNTDAHFFFFQNGRSALFHLMKYLNKKEKTILVVPAFMCTSTIEPLLQNNYEIQYVDIKEDLTIDENQIRRIHEENRKSNIAILVVNYFGLEINNLKLIEYANKNSIKIIIDNSHLIYNHDYKLLNGCFYIYSFRKQIPITYGGILINNSNENDLKINRKRRNVFLIKEFSYQLFKILFIPMISYIGFPNYLKKSKIKKNDALNLNESNFYKKLSISEHAFCKSFVQKLLGSQYLKNVANQRKENFILLKKFLSKTNLTSTLNENENTFSPQAFPVLDESGTLNDWLRKNKIGSYIWPGNEILKVNMNNYPISKKMSEILVLLPIHQGLNSEDIYLISKKLSQWDINNH